MTSELVQRVARFTKVVVFSHAGMDYAPSIAEDVKGLVQSGSRPPRPPLTQVPTSNSESLEISAVLNELGIGEVRGVGRVPCAVCDAAAPVPAGRRPRVVQRTVAAAGGHPIA